MSVFLTGFTQKLRHLFRRNDTNLRESLTDVLQDEAEPDASLRNEELHMMRNLLGLKDVRVNDVMVPRADIVAVPLDIDFTGLREKFIACAHSRLPIYNDTLDDVIGMVHIKDAFALKANAPAPILPSLRRDVLFAPPSSPVLDLLLRMQTSRSHMAIVIDEYGGADGLVTIEDLVEVIIGEIEDEHDEDSAQPFFELRPGVIQASARLAVDRLTEYLQIPLLTADEDIDTLGGLVVSLAGHVPQRGEVIVHDSGVEFEIYDSDARRIKTLRIRYDAKRASDEARG